MRRIKAILVAAALVLGVMAGWKVGWYEVANLQLQEDMRDLANDTGFKYVVSRSDDDLRNAVISKARGYDIDLKPSQVTVQHRASGNASTIYLAADYSKPVDLPGGYSFALHFAPSSAKGIF